MPKNAKKAAERSAIEVVLDDLSKVDHLVDEMWDELVSLRQQTNRRIKITESAVDDIKATVNRLIDLTNVEARADAFFREALEAVEASS
jgi:hypothetical protein